MAVVLERSRIRNSIRVADAMPDLSKVKDALSHSWKQWAVESLIIPWLGPIAHLLFQLRGRSDLEEIAGAVLCPALYIVFGLFAVSLRRDLVRGNNND